MPCDVKGASLGDTYSMVPLSDVTMFISMMDERTSKM